MDKKKIILFSFLISILAISSFFIARRKLAPTITEPWITIFIHGNFNTGLGFLSVSEVFKDNLKNSTYRKVIKNLRADPFFFQEQPILEEGLVPVSPSFDVLKIRKRYGAYPIMSGYKDTLEAIKPNQEENHFFTYGWSGLMSQYVRRKSALRLYNALSETLSELKLKKVNPKIRIVAHSHGGNVSLLLSTINDVLKKKGYDDANSQESTDRMSEIISNLPNKKKAKESRKQFDYKPTYNNLKIDELVMLGTPLQIENLHCLKSRMFGKIYSIYSDQDMAQGSDFVSTKQWTSKQRVDDFNDSAPRFIQAKVMVDKIITEKSVLSSWRKLFLGRLLETSKDPSHKDLWFLAWNPDFCQPNFPLNPLPLVVVVPLITSALDKVDTWDADINLKFLSNQLEVDVLNHERQSVIAKQQIPIRIIDDMKSKVKAWKPANLTREETFKKMYSQL